MAAQKKRMLVPTERLYFWAKRERAREPSFFRTRSRDWRDLIPPKDEFDRPVRFRFRSILLKPKSSRPTWTPWLWVK